jgi:glycosyltransferase involved in cell wall biosynthesis
MGAPRSIWRAVTPRSLRHYGQPLTRALARGRVLSGLRVGEPRFTLGPLIVSGLLTETKGVSEAARLTLAGLRAAGMSTIAHDLRPIFDSRRARNLQLPVNASGGAWVLHVNAPEGIAALAAIDPEAWRGRYRIGYWAYELPLLPKDWVTVSAAFHEIWTPSRFVADAAAAAGVKIPLRVMPHPVSLGTARGRRARADFSLPESDLVVLAMGDLLSSAARKNLVGAIEIYRAAFPQAETARLVVKTQSSKAHPTFEQLARKAAAGRSDIIFMSNTMLQEETRALVASSDILLSPHRAEGFGLPLAEAFLSGVPALATGWSGNLEFMSDLPELLIQHTMTPVDDPYRVYNAPGLEWAEPDLLDAATKLRALSASADLRRRLAERGRLSVEGLAERWTADALKAMPWWELVAQM